MQKSVNTPAAAQQVLSTPAFEARQRIRRGEYAGQTSGIAPGHVQGNLMILPQDLAADFLLFCQRNPTPVGHVVYGPPVNNVTIGVISQQSRHYMWLVSYGIRSKRYEYELRANDLWHRCKN